MISTILVISIILVYPVLVAVLVQNPVTVLILVL